MIHRYNRAACVWRGSVTHRLLGAVRFVIPLIVVVLVAIPAWNYLAHRVRVDPPTFTKDLPKNLDVRTEGFKYSRTEGGKTLFTIRANTTSWVQRQSIPA